jgi:hypothetical protein
MKVKQHHSYIKLLVLSYWIYLCGGKKPLDKIEMYLTLLNELVVAMVNVATHG